MRVLVQWSGGVESTVLLQSILSETSWQVVAHNVYVAGTHASAPRIAKEQEAMKALLPKLQAIRPFTFQQSQMSILGGTVDALERSFQWTYTLAAMTALHCDKTFRGMSLEDNYPRKWLNGRWHYTDPTPGKTPQARREAWLQAIFQGIATANRQDPRPTSIAPWHHSYDKPKSWHVTQLADLAPLTWSCRRPTQEGKPCGVCHSCTELTAAKQGTSACGHVADKTPQTLREEKQ